MNESMDEYKALYKAGPVRVGVLLARTQTGGVRENDSANVQLEGKLVGETPDNLVFEDIRTANPAFSGTGCISSSLQHFMGGKALVRKEYVAVIYALSETASRTP